jgi:fluoride exporter
MNLIAVFIGGGLGSLLRFALSLWLGKHSSGFPTGTFAANVLSCMVIALAWAYFARRVELDEAWRLLVLVGFCGGFSTFSTFSLETLRMIQAGQLGLAVAYVAGSVGCCLLVLIAIEKGAGL